MKILFLTNRLPHARVAGGHRLIYQRMCGLAQRGHEIGLASFLHPEDEDALPMLRTQFKAVESVPAGRRNLAMRMFRDYTSLSMPAIFWKNHAPEMMRTVGNLVERHRFDAVVAEYSEMGLYLYRNPYLSAVHKVVSCHRCLTTSFSKYVETAGVPWALRLKCASQIRMLERYEFELYGAMDHILTLTPEDRFTLLNYAPQLPVSVVPPGIDFNYLDRVDPVQPAQPVIMMCGYFADKSNHDAALWFGQEIWPTVARRNPEAECWLVGLGSSPEMERMACRDMRLQVISSIDDLRPYRAQASIFINPMRLGSGLRIKMLEAMATGLPVVSTSLGAAGIPAQNGVNCFVADTAELFADSIAWLLKDPRLATTMGRSARKMVMQGYHMESTISGLEQLLADVISLDNQRYA